MADFDLYFQWLGIPPEEQPTDHYRPLSIPRFVPDLDVIENAADRQMVHVRTFQTGSHSELSQRLLNELAAARVCLLNEQSKAVYDAELTESLAAKAPPPLPVSATPEPEPATVAEPLAALAVWRQADARLQQGAGDSYKRSIEAAAAWRRTTDYHCSFTRLSSLAESS